VFDVSINAWNNPIPGTMFGGLTVPWTIKGLIIIRLHRIPWFWPDFLVWLPSDQNEENFARWISEGPTFSAKSAKTSRLKFRNAIG
jgi:hypothetical protein